ncbi:MAG: hypothetical protein Kow0075_02280 [Salibacteraceae bacterium]
MRPLVTAVFMCVCAWGIAQVRNSDFQKLFDLYAMEEYEKCAWKAENYSRKDKYRRDPEPYLYMALCFYQAHVHPEKFEEEFKDPLKDALKYAYKFRKKDKTGEMYEANRYLLDKIRGEALDRAKFYFNDGDYRKASLEFYRILKVIPDDVNILFISGVSDILSRNVTQGERNVKIALDSLALYEAENRFEKDPVTHEMLIKAFVSYTDYLAENNQLEKAMEVIVLGRKLVPDDPKLKAQYKKLYAAAPPDEEEDS